MGLFELVLDFMCVLSICKFHKQLIKTKQVMLWTRSNMVFRHSKASNTKVNGPIWSELITHPRSVLII